MQGTPRASQGEFSDEGSIVLKDAPRYVAWTQKSGQGYALAFGADIGRHRADASLLAQEDGFTVMRGYPRLIALGRKDAASEITGFGGPTLLGQPAKSGAGYGFDRDAAFLEALAAKGGEGAAEATAHAGALARGEKSVASQAEGFRLVFDHARLIAEASKAGIGFALAYGPHAGMGRGVSRAALRMLAETLKRESRGPRSSIRPTSRRTA